MALTPPADHEPDGVAKDADITAPFASLADAHRRGRAVRPGVPAAAPTPAVKPAKVVKPAKPPTPAPRVEAPLPPPPRRPKPSRAKPTRPARPRRQAVGRRILVRLFDHSPSAKPVAPPRLSPDTGTTGGIAWAVRSLVLIAGVGITIALAGTWNGTGPTVPEAQPVEEQLSPTLAPASDPTTTTPTTPPTTKKADPPKESDDEDADGNGGGDGDDGGGDDDPTKRPDPDPEPNDPCPADICFVPDDPEPTETYTPYEPEPDPYEPPPDDGGGQLCSVDPTTGQVWCS